MKANRTFSQKIHATLAGHLLLQPQTARQKLQYTGFRRADAVDFRVWDLVFFLLRFGVVDFSVFVGSGAYGLAKEIELLQGFYEGSIKFL